MELDTGRYISIPGEGASGFAGTALCPFRKAASGGLPGHGSSRRVSRRLPPPPPGGGRSGVPPAGVNPLPGPQPPVAISPRSIARGRFQRRTGHGCPLAIATHCPRPHPGAGEEREARVGRGCRRRMYEEPALNSDIRYGPLHGKGPDPGYRSTGQGDPVEHPGPAPVSPEVARKRPERGFDRAGYQVKPSIRLCRCIRPARLSLRRTTRSPWREMRHWPCSGATWRRRRTLCTATPRRAS